MPILLSIQWFNAEITVGEFVTVKWPNHIVLLHRSVVPGGGTAAGARAGCCGLWSPALPVF